MYSVIIATRKNFQDGGRCYDIFSSETHESTLITLKEYHDKMCEGHTGRECNNCNYHDKVIRRYSSCRKFCNDCNNK